VTDMHRTHASTRPQPRNGPPATDAGSVEDLRALGPTTDVVTAGRLLGISRNTAYRLARRGAFPLPLVRAGAQYRVPTAALIAALHPPPAEPATTSHETPPTPTRPT
jgi:excisionase family DNA binding protein